MSSAGALQLTKLIGKLLHLLDPRTFVSKDAAGDATDARNATGRTQG